MRFTKFRIATLIAFCGLAPFGLPPHVGAEGLEADWLRQDVDEPVQVGLLDEPSARKAKAMVKFVQGVLETESDGPDIALQTMVESLELDPSNIRLAFHVSQEFLRRSDTVRAIGVLKDARKANPEAAELPLALSLIYLRHLSKPVLAQQFAKEALEVDPESLNPYEALWEIYRATGARESAANILTQARKVKSDDAEFWMGLAELGVRDQLFRFGRLTASGRKQVAEAVARALELDHADPDMLVRAGDVYAVSEMPADAIRVYEAAYSRSPSFPSLREKLVAGYRETRQSAKAARVLDEIISADPLNLQAYDAAAQLALEAEEYAQAAGYMRQALIIAPENIERHIHYIDSTFRTGDSKATLGAIRDARSQFPGSPRLAYFNAIALSSSGESLKALSAFNEAEQLALQGLPELLTSRFYFDFGAAAEQAGQPARAEELLKHSIELDPQNAADASNYLGYMWVDAGKNLEEAEILIRKALALDPENGAYLDSLGWLEFQRGNFQAALDLLLRSVQNLPSPDPVVFDHLGETFYKLDRPTDALNAWKKALALDPENAAVAAKIEAVTTPVAAHADKSATPPE